jgi:hypothetical protein
VRAGTSHRSISLDKSPMRLETSYAMSSCLLEPHTSEQLQQEALEKSVRKFDCNSDAIISQGSLGLACEGIFGPLLEARSSLVSRSVCENWLQAKRVRS